jgi:hypothetical protein
MYIVKGKLLWLMTNEDHLILYKLGEYLLHCGGHLGGRAQLSDTILEEDHPMTIPSKFGFN